MNGNVPSKQANTYSTIDELKKYFAEPRAGGDEKARLKIVDALQVKGAAAWIVHNAAKRNYDKHRKGIGSSSLTASIDLRYRKPRSSGVCPSWIQPAPAPAGVLAPIPTWTKHGRCGTLQEIVELIGSIRSVSIAHESYVPF